MVQTSNSSFLLAPKPTPTALPIQAQIRHTSIVAQFAVAALYERRLEFPHFFVRCLVKYVYHINFSLDRPTLIAYLLPESQL